MARIPPRAPSFANPAEMLQRMRGEQVLDEQKRLQAVREEARKVAAAGSAAAEERLQTVDEQIDALEKQLAELRQDVPKILKGAGGGRRMIARVLARDYPQLLTSGTGGSSIYADPAALVASSETPRGAGTLWSAGVHLYEEADGGALDYHIITAGGTKLYLLPGDDGYYNFGGMNPAADATFQTPGTGTDDYPLLEKLLDIVTDRGAAFGAAIFFPPGCYRMSTTIQLKKRTILKAHSGGQNGAGAVLQFDPAVRGLIIHRLNTIDDTTAVSTTGADNSLIEGLMFYGSMTGGSLDAHHGIWLRARASIRDCYVQGFKGHGIYVRATAGGGGSAEGNANLFWVSNTTINKCGNCGVYIDGADANAGTLFQVSATFNGRYGVWDSSFLGNTHIQHHSSGNGISNDVNGATTSLVAFGGYRWAAMPSATEADYVATQPGPADWVTGTNYAANDVVRSADGDTLLYRVTVDGGLGATAKPVHAVGAVTGADGYEWTVVGAAWVTGTNYAVGDVVKSSVAPFLYYECTTDGGVASTNEPTHITGALTYADGFGWTVRAQRWVSGTNYAVGDERLSHPLYYRATVDGGVASTDRPTHVTGAFTYPDGFEWTVLDDEGVRLAHDDTVWVYAGDGDQTSDIIQWAAGQPEGTYFAGGAYMGESSGNNCAVFLGCYAEGGQGKSDFTGSVVAIGGNISDNGFTRKTGPHWFDTDLGGFDTMESKEITAKGAGDGSNYYGYNLIHTSPLSAARIGYLRFYVGQNGDGSDRLAGAVRSHPVSSLQTDSTAVGLMYYDVSSEDLEQAIELNGDTKVATLGGGGLGESSWTLGTSTNYVLKGWFGNLSLFPSSSVTPTVNGEVTFQLTADNELAFKVQGSDATDRTGTIPLTSANQQATIASDADFTLTPGTSAPNERHTGTLTADRAATLSNIGATRSTVWVVTRSGAGAFNLNVNNHNGTLLKAQPTSSWGIYRYDGTNYYLAAYGAL